VLERLRPGISSSNSSVKASQKLDGRAKTSENTATIATPKFYCLH
jgi:hypothetical protein